MKDIKWLLVGAGDIAQKRVGAALRDAKHSKLVAVCDINEERVRSLVNEFSVEQSFTSLEEALEKSNCNAVYIATPVHLHVPQALLALDAGFPVLVEKPISLSVEEGKTLITKAKSSGITAATSYYRRLFPAYQYTKQMLENQEFGQVVLVRMIYDSWFSPEPTDPKYWRVIKGKSGSGPISDMGSHMLDVMIGLLGMPEKVSVLCDHLVHDWEVEDTSSILMMMPNGAQVYASFNWSSKTWRHEFELVGRESRLVWYPYDSGALKKTVGREITDLSLPPASNVHLPLVQDFVDALLNGETPVCPLSEGIKVNILMDSVQKAALEGVEVVIPEVEF
ncbi:MAG: Gfo/Idh/MocA family protein [Brevefilum fermentans]|jgi:predicted dehydrogenase|uniref:Putative Oxidoreductase domain-containing protein n=1 Tax=Candidatus Brevifilum fermentans TaxID=1986204 RepID=A0A1Y6K0C9_9CHLR|nr:Gfo/Idh/MocA family oxidoreductase [Brevefilum fermentans]SMX53155.1 putative Oxidoreductase domain-containing protein [Brevefilum fermentans]